MNIPDAAIESGARDLQLCNYREIRGLSLHAYGQAARLILTAALPHLLPGLYVTRHDGDLTVWRDDPDHPDLPQPLSPLELAQALAALLPDRTEDE